MSPKFINIDGSLDFLVSPDTGSELEMGNGCLMGGQEEFPIFGKVPLLFPRAILQRAGKQKLICSDDKNDALMQYLNMTLIKMYHGASNEPAESKWFQLHLSRSKEFFKEIQGTVLDIGCDNPKQSLGMFSNSNVEYLGIDPLFSETSIFKIIGLAEFLPIKDASFDNVCFNTSLDHVFDYFTALVEARRVLKTKGKLLISTLIWHENHQLYHDHHHFHHFKEFEIFGALKSLSFGVKRVERFGWKNNAHREAFYIEVEKLDD